MSTEPSRPNQLYLYELQGIYIRGSLIVYIVVPRVIYAKSRHRVTILLAQLPGHNFQGAISVFCKVAFLDFYGFTFSLAFEEDV